MYILHSFSLPNGRVRVLQLNNGALELCNYPYDRVPASKPADLVEGFNLEFDGDNFRMGDFASGTIRKHVVTYGKCNPKIRGILTKALGCTDLSKFRSC